MSDFTTELLTLEEILIQHKSFKEAYFHAKMNEKLSDVGCRILKERVLGVLRHYQSLSFECLNLFSKHEKNSEEFLLNLLTLFVLRYEGDTDKNQVVSAYQETIQRLRLAMNASEEKKILLKASELPFAVPEEIKASPFLYNSLRLEVPEFFLRTLSQDFKGELALKIALSLHGKCSRYFMKKNSEDSKALDEELFQKTYLSPEHILYKATKPVSALQVKENGLIPVSYLEACALEKVSLPSVAPNVLICSTKNPSLYLMLSMMTLNSYDGKVIPAFDSSVSYRFSMDLMKKQGISNVYPLLSKSHLLKTYLSYDEFDLVVSCSNDSRTGMSRRNIEILPSLTQKDLEKKTSRQKNELKDASFFVKEGGELLFVSYALDKKETTELIAEFLKENPRFTLVDQAFLFPFETEQEGGYYALLRRKA